MRIASAATGSNKGCPGCEVITRLLFISKNIRASEEVVVRCETVVSANELAVCAGSIFFSSLFCVSYMYLFSGCEMMKMRLFRRLTYNMVIWMS